MRSQIESANIIWFPKAVIGQKNEIESVQKRFPRYMYYRDFHYYDYTISCRELVHGYNLVEPEKRPKMTSMLLLRDILRGNLDSSYFLGEIGLDQKNITVN